VETFRLSDIGVGEKAVVAGFDAGGANYRGKLLSMGLTPGVEITLAAVAPLGDPVEIELRGFHLSLRKDEAEVIRLRRNG
jgi:ferrous iron transport protein A